MARQPATLELALGFYRHFIFDLHYSPRRAHTKTMDWLCAKTDVQGSGWDLATEAQNIVEKGIEQSGIDGVLILGL